MKALAEKSSSKDTLTRNRQGTNQKQGPVKISVPAFSGSIPLIQRKALCPCDGGCPNCSGPIQPKLTIGQPNDKYEQEADRIADQIMRMPERMEKEPEVEELMQIKSSTNIAPPVTVGLQSQIESLIGGGQPLPESTRAFFEPRFGHNFSQVRIHNDSQANEAAKSLNARAFTKGNHMVFGSDQYSPGTLSGKVLLAHELTHVIQQRRGITHELQCWTNLHWARRFGGRGIYYSQDELIDYLDSLRERNRIEGRIDSDNKARAIINVWRMGLPGSPYDLSPMIKKLMIEEMLAGVTGNDDEQAILEILNRCENHEFEEIFGPGGIRAERVYRNFQGDERRRLGQFFFRRFRGGLTAITGRAVTSRDLRSNRPVPRGTELPQQIRYHPWEIVQPVPTTLEQREIEYSSARDDHYCGRNLRNRTYSEFYDPECQSSLREYCSIQYDQLPRCCMRGMLEEIQNLRINAANRLFQAASRLSASPGDLRWQLRRHFNVNYRNQEHVNIIIHQLELVLHDLLHEPVVFICRDYWVDNICASSSGGRAGGRTWPSCNVEGQRYVLFCGNYQNFVENGTSFLGQERGLWSLIHEYVHVSCRPNRSSQSISGGVNECYNRPNNPQCQYPPEVSDALRNADSYTSFILDVTFPRIPPPA